MATTQTRRPVNDGVSGGGFPGAVAAEWTKLRGLRSTALCLVVAVLATGGTALLAALALEANGGFGTVDAHTLVRTATMLSQFAVVAVASLVVTGEYATGAMRTTLTTVPRRGRMLGAKAGVLAAVTFATGAVAGALTIAATGAVFGEAVDYSGSNILYATVGTGSYMMAVSLFTLGLGLMMRSTAGAITGAVAVLLAIPTISMTINDETITKVVSYLPAHAAMTLIASIDDPYGWGVGALLLTGWVTLSLGAGYAFLSRRDA